MVVEGDTGTSESQVLGWIEEKLIARGDRHGLDGDELRHCRAREERAGGQQAQQHTLHRRLSHDPLPLWTGRPEIARARSRNGNEWGGDSVTSRVKL